MRRHLGVSAQLLYLCLPQMQRLLPCLGGEIGRRNGLKIRRSERFMRVRFPPQAPSQSRVSSYFEAIVGGFLLHMNVCIYARL